MKRSFFILMPALFALASCGTASRLAQNPVFKDGIYCSTRPTAAEIAAEEWYNSPGEILRRFTSPSEPKKTLTINNTMYPSPYWGAGYWRSPLYGPWGPAYPYPYYPYYPYGPVYPVGPVYPRAGGTYYSIRSFASDGGTSRGTGGGGYRPASSGSSSGVSVTSRPGNMGNGGSPTQYRRGATGGKSEGFSNYRTSSETAGSRYGNTSNYDSSSSRYQGSNSYSSPGGISGGGFGRGGGFSGGGSSMGGGGAGTRVR